MPIPLFHLAAYIVSFVFVWIGAGFIVKSVVKLAQYLRLPAFTISFLLLGLLTSLPEATIGFLSVVEHRPQIFVGNLLGATIVIFLGIIPLFGIVGNGIKMPRRLSFPELIFALAVIISPAVLTLDGQLTAWKSLLMVISYFVLIIFLFEKQTLADKFKSSFKKKKAVLIYDFIFLGLGLVFLLVASQQIIYSTLYFAEVFELSPFFVSLIVVAIGTNIPELSLIIRSIFEKKQEIALADYIGSASANTLLFGVFSLMYGGPIFIPNQSMQRFIFLLVGVILFFIFIRSRRVLSRIESLVIFGLYILFIAFELFVVA